ncbi:uncharacterized protein J7T54_007136 [Emericellopsis cladophorae]|uniref:SMP-30/Gluconolactonase/LRE-like region domain-containing protein n=1 Tax=Emericellopsis cladophorae TaxID=2686198 RepID=A0A9P9Y8T5_9HYPO|nr:uncharacterized protein J7T54_007136 [Emericellopsis cladophorae]KAI6785493.1 hypothetical protein J7T54_007136 [Emericellopsis cladophorae]
MAVVKGTGSHDQAHDPNLRDTVLLDQLPSDMWTEGMVVRPNGDVLTTRLEEPDMFSIDIATAAHFENDDGTVRPRLLKRFPDANGCFNLCALEGTKREEYAVVTGFADLARGQFHSWALWRMALPPDEGDDKAEYTKIMDIPDAGFLMGIVPVSDSIVAIADSIQGRIWRVDLARSECSVLFEDPSLAAPSEASIFGINKLRFSERFGWFTNTGTGKLYRFPIERTDDGKDIKPVGDVVELAADLENADGLVITPDGSSAYVCSYTAGHLWRIDTDGEAGSGSSTVHFLRDDLVSPTAMDLVYKKNEKPTLYIMCCGRVNSEVLEGERGHWLSLANVDKDQLQIMVTVTTEVTYEYI